MPDPTEAPVVVPTLADELEAPEVEVKAPEDNLEGGEKAPEALATPEATVVDPSREMDDLRQIIRQQRMHLAALQNQMGKLQRPATAQPAPKGSDVLDDVFGEKASVPVEKPAEPQPTHFEALQQELSYLGATKGPVLDILIEVMAMKPGYEDIKDVCSQPRFTYLVDTAAQAYSQEKGVDLAIATLEVEAAIWRKANPYEWMHKMIKEVHPDFRKVTTSAVVQTVVPPVQDKKPVEAPTSIVPLGGGSADQGSGWTAAKIDAMDDEDYGKIPANIREKYLAGELDAK
jgi:hypothetical protein